MSPTRDFLPTDQISTPEDLVSLLCEPLPATDVICEADGRWRFWQDPAWVPDDLDAPIPLYRENP